MALMLDALTHPRAVAPMTGGMVTTGAVIDIARVGFGGLLAGRLSVAPWSPSGPSVRPDSMTGLMR